MQQDCALLVIDGLSRRFGDMLGSGKTTLLRCAVGADRPDEGDVHLDGEPLRETDPRARAAVLDDVEFFPDLSVSEHLDLVARAHGTADPAVLVAGTLAELRLGRVADQLPATLSSGERRRLALASWWVRPRRLLIFDEPEQRLDSVGRRWLVERLCAEKETGSAILFASHDERVVDGVADVLLRLDL